MNNHRVVSNYHVVTGTIWRGRTDPSIKVQIVDVLMLGDGSLKVKALSVDSGSGSYLPVVMFHDAYEFVSY